MMCSECTSFVSSAVALGLIIFALVALLLALYISKKYEIRQKSVRMYFLEKSLKHQCVVQDPNELECLTEYIELLVKLGFKTKEINRMVLSCCFTQDFG